MANPWNTAVSSWGIPANSTSYVAQSFTSVARDQWGQDTPTCHLCSAGFTLLRRRHHCRKCGQCVCGACSPNAVMLEGYATRQRVCKACVGAAMLDCSQLIECAQLRAEINRLRERMGELQGQSAEQGGDTALSINSLTVKLRQFSDERRDLERQNDVLKSQLLRFTSLEGSRNEEIRTLKAQLARLKAEPPRLEAETGEPDQPRRVTRIYTAGTLSPDDSPGTEDEDFGLTPRQFEEAGRRDTVHEEALRDHVSGMAQRLQSLLVSVAGMADVDAPLHDSDNAAEACDKTIAAVETMLPQLQQRLAKPETMRSPPATEAPLPNADSGSATPGADEQKICHVCNAKLGKRYLNPRQICNLCDKSVCGSCMSRLCATCVARASPPNPFVDGTDT
mmetsp:Transcript_35830/g.100795  ORF Transcript_35830/g.100795 Transcript_35830/m.100795 type:complete len:393 (-) Transcript_35830:105-1283(-)